MEVSEAKRLKALEDENARLKTLLSEQMLDAAHSASFSQKMYGPPRRCEGPRHRKMTIPVA
jgi:hypothetical protein